MQKRKPVAPADRLVSVRPVAELLGCSHFHVYELVKRGSLPHVKLGSRLIRFDLAKVREWIASGGAAQKARA